MIPVNMILSLDQGPKWKAQWDEGKAQGDDIPQPLPAPARFLPGLAFLQRITLLMARSA